MMQTAHSRAKIGSRRQPIQWKAESKGCPMILYPYYFLCKINSLYLCAKVQKLVGWNSGVLKQNFV